MPDVTPENTGTPGDIPQEPVPGSGTSPVTQALEPTVLVNVDVDSIIPYLTDIIENQRSTIIILQFFAAFVILWVVYRIFHVAYRFFNSFF